MSRWPLFDAALDGTLTGALPDDMADAFESMKLAILRHHLDGWNEVSQNAVVNTLYALQQIALMDNHTQPSPAESEHEK